MEFRVFFPILDSSDSSFLSNEDFVAYAEQLEALRSSIATASETRGDSYFLTKSFFGLKYRHGKKLELKIRDKSPMHGIERWTKFKLGKKSADHYKSDICGLISNFGYTDVSIDDPSFTFSMQITVEKSRQNEIKDETCYEVCQIEIPLEQPYFCGTIRRRRWLSIAVEGESKNIDKYLLSNEAESIRKLLATLCGYKDIAKVQNFVPIVSGYPMFLNYIASESTPIISEIDEDVLNAWDDLMQLFTGNSK